MDCRITSIKSPARRRGGFTLIEMLMAAAMGSVVAIGVASLMFYTGRSFAAMANYIDLDNQSRIALDTISRDIRQANKLTAYTSTSLTFEESDGSTLQIVYDQNAQTLSRTVSTVPGSKVLLRECTFCQFDIFQRNPIGGAYNQYPTADPSTCKLVQLHWVCRRTTLGTIINTESVQSAKVVIRKA